MIFGIIESLFFGIMGIKFQKTNAKFQIYFNDQKTKLETN